MFRKSSLALHVFTFTKGNSRLCIHENLSNRIIKISNPQIMIDMFTIISIYT